MGGTSYRNQPRIRFLSDLAHIQQYARLCDFELTSFDAQPEYRQMYFTVTGDGLNVRYRFTHAGGPLVVQTDHQTTVEVQSGIEEWVELSEWLSINPPVFFSSDRSVFDGMNLMTPPSRRLANLSQELVRTIPWDGCNIGVEFLIDDGSPQSAQRRNQLGLSTTVQEHLETHLRRLEDLKILFYDHRSGEAADFIAVTHSSDGILRIGFYHCKAAGGLPSGSRVGDVYEVAGQMVKSVSYCDDANLIKHMEHRIGPRHSQPSRFLVGSLELFSELLRNTSQVSREFEIIGVQPGVDHTQIDSHLSDLMAFGIDYTKQGGAATAYWITS